MYKTWQVYLDIVYFVARMHLYTLAKDVERGGGDRKLYIVDLIRIKLPYQLLDFPQTCVVFYVESIIVLWCGYCTFYLIWLL